MTVLGVKTARSAENFEILDKISAKVVQLATLSPSQGRGSNLGKK